MPQGRGWRHENAITVSELAARVTAEKSRRIALTSWKSTGMRRVRKRGSLCASIMGAIKRDSSRGPHQKNRPRQRSTVGNSPNSRMRSPKSCNRLVDFAGCLTGCDADAPVRREGLSRPNRHRDTNVDGLGARSRRTSAHDAIRRIAQRRARASAYTRRLAGEDVSTGRTWVTRTDAPPAEPALA